MKYNKETVQDEAMEFLGVRDEEFIDKQKLLKEVNEIINNVWQEQYKQRMRDLANRKFQTLNYAEFKDWVSQL